MKNLLKNPRFWTGLIVAAILVTIIVQSKKPETVNQQMEEESRNTQQSNQQITAPETRKEQNSWEGILKTSDNPQKGNLMLVTADKKIYIKTSRDFSVLLEKKVAVTYEGTAESFRLGDIVESN